MILSNDLIAASRNRATRSGVLRGISSSASLDGPRKVGARQRQDRYRTLLGQGGDPAQARAALERLIGGNDLVGIAYLERGVLQGRPVGRVHLRDSAGSTAGFGTGFLVAPGVLMTNHHVISSPDEARGSTVEFDFELDVRGVDKPVAEFALALDAPPITVAALDFCLVGVAPRSLDSRRALAEFGWLALDPTPGKAFVGEYLTIIQHPGGERKQICVRENQLLRYDDADTTIWYRTDTVAGSSGSPVFNNSWQVVALHHSGVPRTDRQGRWLTADGRPWDDSMDESKVAWIANEGVRISRILAYLQANCAQHPLAQAVLARPAMGPVTPLPNEDLSSRAEARDGELRVTVPVVIAVRLGTSGPLALGSREPSAPNGLGSPTAASSAASASAATAFSVPAAGGMEVVVVDQSNYKDRPGYNPSFLGSGLKVPLPKIASAAQRKLLASVRGSTTGELKYWNYSVLLNKARRLAFVSAVNVDASQRPKDAGRDGDRWYVDTRVDAKLQLDQSFYGRQSSFESAAELDRSTNPFDRGHLTRRLDAQWGPSAAISTRSGNDSFHFANCAPQHWQYNQGAKRWLGLEDYVISGFAGGGKACVFNGPVFDAPRSRPGPDGRFVPDLRGTRSADPTFGGVAIPKQFYKIVVCRRASGALAAAAFLMSQEDLLRGVGKRLKGLQIRREEVLTDREARLYQVRVADVEALTGLDFGAARRADTRAQEGLELAGPRTIETLTDIRL